MITITTVRQNVTYLTLTFDVYGPYYAISKIPSEQTDEDKRRFPHEIEQFESDKKEWDNKYSCGEGINCISGNEYNFEFSDYDMFRRGLLTSCIIRHYLRHVMHDEPRPWGDPGFDFEKFILLNITGSLI